LDKKNFCPGITISKSLHGEGFGLFCNFAYDYSKKTIVRMELSKNLSRRRKLKEKWYG
jgi:hypothetical protein